MLGRGYCKFGGDTCIGLEDIARKREGGGARNSPPVGRGLRNLLVCESLLFLDEKARNQFRYNFIIFEQLSC